MRAVTFEEGRLAERGVEVLQGPVEKTGTLGSMQSGYVRVPYGNLVEISPY